MTNKAPMMMFHMGEVLVRDKADEDLSGCALAAQWRLVA
jgi:hypothetical protein